MQMVVSDLDGTLLGKSQKFTPEIVSLFDDLGKKKIVRVIATGRTLHSTPETVPPDFPLDYLVFSTGTGVFDWKTRKVIKAHELHPKWSLEIDLELKERDLSFMAHFTIPDNHHFYFYVSPTPEPDFVRRLDRQRSFASPWAPHDQIRVSQFVTILASRKGPPLHAALTARFPKLHVSRVTSPLDPDSMWVEIFAEGVSKASGTNWVAEKEGISKADVLAIGNDYNDLDLLEWAGTAFVADNAPEGLKEKFKVVASPEGNGVVEAVRLWL